MSKMNKLYRETENVAQPSRSSMRSPAQRRMRRQMTYAAMGPLAGTLQKIADQARAVSINNRQTGTEVFRPTRSKKP
jgi:hypothetical protein